MITVTTQRPHAGSLARWIKAGGFAILQM